MGDAAALLRSIDVAKMRSFHCAPIGQLNELWTRPSPRAIQERIQLTDGWNAAVPSILLRVLSV